MQSTLHGKVAIITGGSSGIGRATASMLDRNGVRLVLVGRDANRLAEVSASLNEPAQLVVADAGLATTAQHAVDTAVAHFGRLDIAIPNAGIYLSDPGWSVDPATINEIVTTNVLGVMHLVHAALRHYSGNGNGSHPGDILVTSSVSGHQAISWEPVYSATKHAIQGFVHATRQQIIGTENRLMAIAPGIVLNELWGRFVHDQSVDEELAAGRGMTSDDVAEAIEFMLTRPRHLTVRDLVLLPTAQPI
jgi:ribitol 2-dehydrogenase